MWMGEIKKYAQSSVKKILVGNKSDLEDKRAVSEDEGRELAKFYGIEFLETSAKNTTNIEESFLNLSNTIVEKLDKNLDEENLINISNKEKNRKEIGKGCC